MSKTEVHKGKATPLNLDLFGFLTAYPELIEDTYKDRDDIYDIFYNGLKCGYEKYILLGDMVWELDNTELDEYDTLLAEKNSDGSFNYFVIFYNGSCCLSEAIECAMEKAE